MRSTGRPEAQDRATWSRPELQVLDVGGSEATPWIEGFARVIITLKYGQGRGDFVYRFEPT